MERTDVDLSLEQQQAFERYSAGDNVFLTGPGGTGKSLLVRKIYQDCKDRNKHVAVCALTGCAAVLLQCRAKTIHSWAGVGRCYGEQHKIIERVADNKFKRANWKDADVLIVDEVSMMSRKLFEVLNNIAKLIKKSQQPFGGMQVLFIGDFFQLPPVGEKGEPDTTAFCFESEEWFRVFPIENNIQLKKIFRQEDDKYASALNQIREGKIKKSAYELLMKQVGKMPAADCLVQPTKLYPVRASVDQINKQELAKIDEEEHKFSVCRLHDLCNTGKKGRPQEIDFEFRYLEESIPGDKEIVLKKGAQVMYTINSQDTGLYNGSQGRVVGFSATGMPIVKFRGIHVPLEVTPHTWPSEALPHIGVRQLPLILCWALTIHKAQGATLEYAEIDVGSNVFESGQTYVALSRVKSIDGLFLTQFNYQKIITSKKVSEFYRRITSGELPDPPAPAPQQQTRKTGANTPSSQGPLPKTMPAATQNQLFNYFKLDPDLQSALTLPVKR